MATRYCLMIITEFGYKAPLWHGILVGWWICVIFRFHELNMNCRIGSMSFYLNKHGRTKTRISCTCPSPRWFCSQIYFSEICAFWNLYQYQIGLKSCKLALFSYCPETFASETLGPKRKHWFNIVLTSVFQVLLCIYLMFKGVQRASACEHFLFIFMV